MYRLIISVQGDNEQLHRKALEAAVEVIEGVNHAPVYRAYLEKIEDGKLVGVPNSRIFGLDEVYPPREGNRPGGMNSE